MPISSGGRGGEGRGQREKGRKRPRCFDATTTTAATATAFVLRENAQPSRRPSALLVHAARLNRLNVENIRSNTRTFEIFRILELYVFWNFSFLRLFGTLFVDSRQLGFVSSSLIGEEGGRCKIYNPANVIRMWCAFHVFFEISFVCPKLDGPVWFVHRVDIGFVNSLDTISWICGCARKKKKKAGDISEICVPTIFRVIDCFLKRAGFPCTINY